MSEDARTVGTVSTVGGGVESGRALLIVYGDHEAGERSRLLELPEGAEVSFGRSRVNTVHIDSERVSRNHARLQHRDGEITIEDLDSRNGTRVNGAKITAVTRLCSGDEITIGPATALLSMTTGLVPRPMVGTTADLEERLEAEVDRGLRYRRSFALIMMRISGSSPAVDDALDRLCERLRPMDTIAEYSPEEFAILVPEADRTAAVAHARALMEATRPRTLDSEAATTRAGIALFPEHGTQSGRVISRAREALKRADRGDEGEIVVSGRIDDIRPQSEPLVIIAPQMKRVFALVDKVAATNMTVLIIGETGVGKEVVAKRIHGASARASKKLLCLNCAAIAETLLESELFGHERGAFTGADRQRIGYFEAAHHGTIFLDEIGELSARLQAKLLRVLEGGSFTRVGGSKELTVDARVICATHRNLEREVAEGRFREDLFFRLSAFTVVVPPLRDRREDLVELARSFARASDGPTPVFSSAAVAALERHTWPGNVRELRNAVERACLLQEHGVIELEHLPDRVREAAFVAAVESGPSGMASDTDVRQHLAEIERTAIVAAMESCGGNQTHAARKLGMSRRSLIYKLEKYGLKKKPPSRKPPPPSGRG